MAHMTGAFPPSEELGRRASALRRILDVHGVDALVMFGSRDQPGPARYLTGFEPWCAPGEWAIGVLSRAESRRPILLTNSPWDFLLQTEDLMPSVEVHVGSRWQELLESLNLGPLRSVGLVHRWGIPLAVLEAVQNASGGASVFDVSEDVDKLRAIKSDYEVRQLSKANEIALHALDAARQHVIPGANELDVARVLGEALNREETLGVAFPTNVLSGPRTEHVCARPVDRVLREGEIVQIDCSPIVGGYMADVAHVFGVGEVEGEPKALLEAASAAHDRAVEHLAAGNAMSEVGVAVVEALEAVGLSAGNLYRSVNTGEAFVAHGIGLANPDPPGMLNLGGGGLLEDGMVVNVEPIITMADVGTARIERAFLIEGAIPRPLGIRNDPSSQSLAN